jgi:hypothetical protein
MNFDETLNEWNTALKGNQYVLNEKYKIVFHP